MNGMMITMDMIAMFGSTASSVDQPSVSGPGHVSLEDYSFLRFLLAAFNGAVPVQGNETPLEHGEALSMFPPLNGIENDAEDPSLESTLMERSMTEGLGLEIQKDGMGQLLDSQGAEPTQGDGAKEVEASGQIVKGWGNENPDASRGITGADGAKADLSPLFGSPEALEETVGGETGKDPAAPREVPWGFRDGISEGIDRATGWENRRDPGIPLETQQVFEEDDLKRIEKLVGWKDTHVPRPSPEVRQVLRDGASPSPEEGLEKRENSLWTRALADLSDGEKADTGEALSRTFQNLIRRSYAHHLDPQRASEGNAARLSDASLPNMSEKEGFRNFMPVHEEATSSPATQPLASGEMGTAGGRPLPVFLTDGAMQQILENLNVRNLRIGQKDLRIQLHPEELGRVRMEIGMRDHQVVLKIHVENPLVKDLIENSLAQLREGLLDQGLKMGRCSVSVGEFFHHQSGGHSENLAASDEDHSVPIDSGEIEETRRQGAASLYYGDSDLVNLFI